MMFRQRVKHAPLALLALATLLMTTVGACQRCQAQDVAARQSQEPTIETASQWWSPQRNVWTPIGWKDHYFRFNVLYNGSLIADPCPHWLTPRPNSREFLDQDLLLTFTPSPGGAVPPMPPVPTKMAYVDSGVGIQSWDEGHATPVLRTDWPCQEGVVIQQQVFAHVPGERDVQTGVEPLYAWVRLKVTHVDEIAHVEKMPIAIQISKVCLFHGNHFVQEHGATVDVHADQARLPTPLTAETTTDGKGQAGLLVKDPEGKVRLAVLPTGEGRVAFKETTPGSQIYAMSIDMHAKVGDYVDLLVPMQPAPVEAVVQEEKLGFEGALALSDPYWSKRPEGVARVEVPEEFINRAIAQNIKFAETIAEKDHVTGEYSFLTGSWGYDLLWATPTSMTSHMFLDPLGYHGVVDKHMEILRKHQGENVPPGAGYTQHPGYFGVPKTLTSIDWLSDHGAVLHQASVHALLTDDAEFIERWTEPIVKGCDFIKDSCARTDHDGVKGLLPPAVATDDGIPMQAVWNLAWNYKGLTSAVRLLKRINHPRAAEFDELSKQYKETFIKAFREQSAKATQWTDAEGNKHPQPPTSLSTSTPQHIFTHAFYLDTGPMVLVWADLLPADNPLMLASAKFFREGPNHKLIGARSNPLCRPVLEHEISTCEPCYSWNIFHSWQLGDREKFLTGLYALFTGAISPNTYISGEHRHGIYGNIFVFPTAFTLAQLAVIDDKIVPGEFHLLRLCPKAWLSAEKQTVFEKIATEHGPVTLRFQLTDAGRTLDVDWEPSFRTPPEAVTLHVPEIEGLEAVVINGERRTAKPGDMLKL